MIGGFKANSSYHSMLGGVGDIVDDLLGAVDVDDAVVDTVLRIIPTSSHSRVRERRGSPSL